jgi:hypothetical protein
LKNEKSIKCDLRANEIFEPNEKLQSLHSKTGNTPITFRYQFCRNIGDTNKQKQESTFDLTFRQLHSEFQSHLK